MPTLKAPARASTALKAGAEKDGRIRNFTIQKKVRGCSWGRLCCDARIRGLGRLGSGLVGWDLINRYKQSPIWTGVQSFPRTAQPTD